MIIVLLRDEWLGKCVFVLHYAYIAGLVLGYLVVSLLTNLIIIMWSTKDVWGVHVYTNIYGVTFLITAPRTSKFAHYLLLVFWAVVQRLVQIIFGLSPVLISEQPLWLLIWIKWQNAIRIWISCFTLSLLFHQNYILWSFKFHKRCTVSKLQLYWHYHSLSLSFFQLFLSFWLH